MTDNVRTNNSVAGQMGFEGTTLGAINETTGLGSSLYRVDTGVFLSGISHQWLFYVDSNDSFKIHSGGLTGPAPFQIEKGASDGILILRADPDTLDYSGGLDVTGDVNITGDYYTNDVLFLDTIRDIVKGVDWKESVLSQVIAEASAVETVGNRYIAPAAGATWTQNYIYEWVESTTLVADVETVTEEWSETIPTEGAAIWVEDEDKQYVYNGSSWALFGSGVTHNSLLSLQGGTADEYYHLTNSAYGNLSSQDQEVLTSSYPTFNQLNVSGVFNTIGGILNIYQPISSDSTAGFADVTINGSAGDITGALVNNATYGYFSVMTSNDTDMMLGANSVPFIIISDGDGRIHVRKDVDFEDSAAADVLVGGILASDSSSHFRFNSKTGYDLSLSIEDVNFINLDSADQTIELSKPISSVSTATLQHLTIDADVAAPVEDQSGRLQISGEVPRNQGANNRDYVGIDITNTYDNNDAVPGDYGWSQLVFNGGQAEARAHLRTNIGNEYFEIATNDHYDLMLGCRRSKYIVLRNANSDDRIDMYRDIALWNAAGDQHMATINVNDDVSDFRLSANSGYDMWLAIDQDPFITLSNANDNIRISKEINVDPGAGVQMNGANLSFTNPGSGETPYFRSINDGGYGTIEFSNNDDVRSTLAIAANGVPGGNSAWLFMATDNSDNGFGTFGYIVQSENSLSITSQTDIGITAQTGNMSIFSNLDMAGDITMNQMSDENWTWPITPFTIDMEDAGAPYTFSDIGASVSTREDGPGGPGNKAIKVYNNTGASAEGTTFEPDPWIQLSLSKITIDVYSTFAIVVQLNLPEHGQAENAQHNGGGWESLEFNYQYSTGGVSTMDIIFDPDSESGEAGPWTFYFDNISTAEGDNVSPVRSSEIKFVGVDSFYQSQTDSARLRGDRDSSGALIVEDSFTGGYSNFALSNTTDGQQTYLYLTPGPYETATSYGYISIRSDKMLLGGYDFVEGRRIHTLNYWITKSMNENYLERDAMISNQMNNTITSAAPVEIIRVEKTFDVMGLPVTYDGAVFNCVIKSDAGDLRTSTVHAVWDGSSVEYTETGTNDIGDTSPLTLTVEDDGGTDIILKATVTDGNTWTVKAVMTLI